jgi:hypothetical protein
MNNYPPEVNGSEIQIAGHDEIDLKVFCHSGHISTISIYTKDYYEINSALINLREFAQVNELNYVSRYIEQIMKIMFDRYRECCENDGFDCESESETIAYVNDNEVTIECPECLHDYKYNRETFFNKYNPNKTFILNSNDCNY